MSPFLLYLLFLKASITSFTGLGPLPMLRNDFVIERHVLTDRELNIAVVAGRTSPGPFGLYIVCIGYRIAGLPGGFAGLLAILTPAFIAVPIMTWVGKRANSPRVKEIVRAIVLGSVGLLISASVPLSMDAIQGPLTLIIFLVSFAALAFTRIETAWLMLGSAVVGLAAKLLA